MDYPYGEFGDCTFSRFGSTHTHTKAHRRTHRQTQMYALLSRLVGVSKYFAVNFN